MSFSEGGFNLIEVTLAVAVVGVGMLAIIGMLSAAVESSRQVSDDTLITNLTDDMLNWARVTPFGKQTFMPVGASLTNYTTTVERGLDANGTFRTLESSSITNQLWAGNKSTGFGYYRFSFTPIPYSTNGITRVLVTVEWPINPGSGLPTAKASRRQYVTQVARR